MHDAPLTDRDGATSSVGGPTIYPATGSVPARSPWRLTTVALALTLLLGVIGGGWLVKYWLTQTSDAAPKSNSVAAAQPAPRAAAPAASIAVAAAPVAVGAPADVSARIAALEERLARLSIAADSASGNAAKAEAILVAFAARRAIDRGLGLGAMEAQVRLRFGESQPNAVQSILSAASRPVLQEELIQRLDALRPALLIDSDASWMTRIGDSISSLIILRPSDAPSQLPPRKFERAQRALASGRLEVAIVEVESMPGGRSTLVEAWLNDARRLHDARRALDLIEAAAIIEPGGNRGAVATP